MTVISDLDGTLFSQEGAVPDQLARLVSSIQSLQSGFVVATSRPLHDVRRIFGPYDFVFVAILNDGSESIKIESASHFTVLDELILSASEVDDLLASVIGLDILPFVFLSHSAARQSMVICPPFLAEEKQLLSSLTPGRQYNASDSVTAYISNVASNRTTIRAIGYFLREERSELIRSTIGPMLQHVPSIRLLDYPDTRCKGHHWLELVPSNTGKRRAIERLLDRGLIKRPLIGFGNGINDVEFLQICDYSLCPSDAETLVQDVVSEIAPTCGGGSFCDWVSSKLEEIYERLQL